MATANYMTMESFPLFAREFTSRLSAANTADYQDATTMCAKSAAGA